MKRNEHFSLEGFDELTRALKEELPKTTARAVMRRAGIKAMQPIADRMARLAPYDPEDRDGDGQHLRDTMKVQAAKARFARKMGTPPKDGVVILAGPGPKGRRARAVARSLEWGTDERFQKKTGRSTGALPAQPYARPAADIEVNSTLSRVRRLLIDEIDKAKKRIARKAARDAARGR